jgi:rubrerythrin
MGKTLENLKEAFAGESQANRKYLAFAAKADDEGYKMVARLFRAAAAAETIHAHNHLKVMAGVGDTAENLEAAMSGEAEEFRSMYPEFIGQAQAEGNGDAVESFDVAMKVEKIHHDLYAGAAERLKGGKDMPYTNWFVCRGCGNTVDDKAPDKCPICGAPKSWFMWIA